jgi:hypothetical protein
LTLRFAAGIISSCRWTKQTGGLRQSSLKIA